jgi:hypothetical protein
LLRQVKILLLFRDPATLIAATVTATSVAADIVATIRSGAIARWSTVGAAVLQPRHQQIANQ